MFALTATEAIIVEKLRQKISDCPTRTAVSSDKGKTLMIYGELTSVTDEMVNVVDVPDTQLQVWNDYELLMALKSAHTQIFGKKSASIESLDEMGVEALVLKAQIGLLYTLSINSAKYAKYTTRDAAQERVSPTEFVSIAKALEKTLQNMLTEDEELNVSAGSVSQGKMTRYSKRTMFVEPREIVLEPKKVTVQLESTAEGVSITMPSVFFPDYKEHLIKRKDALQETIIATFYNISDVAYVDKDVTSGTAYTYMVYLFDISGNYSISSANITYVKPS